MSGIKGSKLNEYMESRREKSGIEPLELRVDLLYMRLKRDKTCSSEGIAEWLEEEVTVEDLLTEFNEHELIELLQEGDTP